MGSCAGKASSAKVVSAHIHPVDPQHPNAPKPYNESVSHNNDDFQAPKLDNPQVQQANDSNKISGQHHQNAHTEMQQPQPQPQINKTAKYEEKSKKGQGIDDIDEDDFVDQLKKKEAPKMAQVKATEEKQENNLAGDPFALNFPGSQFASENAKKDTKPIEENKRYQSKHKENNVKNIINNPDELEQSFSSQGDLAKALDKNDEDDFDIVENVHQNNHTKAVHENSASHRPHQLSSSNNSQENAIVFHEQRHPNRVSLAESASPMSGVIKNKTPEKEKVIEFRESGLLGQEHHEIHSHQHHQDENPHLSDRKAHQNEEPHHHERETHQEQPHFYDQSNKDDITKIKSPGKIIESRNQKIDDDDDEPIKFYEDELKIIDTPKKKEDKVSPQKNTMKISQEKMPWERNSVPFDDENEIEFFDDELES